jgi:hypothetical protein
MRRTLLQFDEGTYNALRLQAFRQKRSIASVVREFVLRGLGETTPQPPTDVSQLASVRAGRSKQRRSSRVSEKHDDALAAAFEK